MGWVGRIVVASVAVVVSVGGVGDAGAWPTDEAVHEILRERVEDFGQGVGFVVGMLDSTGTRIVSYGKMTYGGDRDVDGETLFEIGSITKVFMSILLADMVDRGELALTDRVAQHLPPSVHFPTGYAREATLLDLVTHRSSLPGMPDDLGVDAAGAYEHYTMDQLLAFVNRAVPGREVGDAYQYSNLAFGVLGAVMEHRTGKTVATLLAERICNPLGLSDTVFELNPEQRTRFADGHDWTREPAPQWTPGGGMDAAGALRSTTQDLLRFAAANMGMVDSPVWRAMQVTHLDRRDTFVGNLKIGLGWHLTSSRGREIIWHGGATYGYQAFLGFDKESRRAVVVMCNARAFFDDIAFHLFDESFKLAEQENPERGEPIEVKPAQRRAFAGDYEIRPGLILRVQDRDGKLYAQFNAGLPVEMVCVDRGSFYMKLMPVELSFSRIEDGQSESVELRQMGFEHEAKRVPASPSPHHRVDAEDPGLFAPYAGRYKGDTGPAVRIDVGTDSVYAQGEGQLRMALVPMLDGRFWAREASAELAFEEEAGRPVLVIRQEGESYRLPRQTDAMPAGDGP